MEQVLAQTMEQTQKKRRVKKKTEPELTKTTIIYDYTDKSLDSKFYGCTGWTSLEIIIDTLFNVDKRYDASVIRIKRKGDREIDTPKFIVSSGVIYDSKKAPCGYWVDNTGPQAQWLTAEWCDQEGKPYGKVKISFHKNHAVVDYEYFDPFTFADVLLMEKEILETSNVFFTKPGTKLVVSKALQEGNLSFMDFSHYVNERPVVTTTAKALKSTQRHHGTSDYSIPDSDSKTLVFHMNNVHHVPIDDTHWAASEVKLSLV